MNKLFILIHPVKNGWLLDVKPFEHNKDAYVQILERHVFNNPKDLGQFIEDFYTKKDEH